MRLGFLASNNGSSLRAIVSAIETGALAAQACLVVSNRKSAPALAFAREHGLAALYIPTVSDPAAADARLAEAMRQADVEYIILSGYLRKLGVKTLEAFAGRILNIHPALLPLHGGQGMFGRRVHEAVIAADDRFTGATVHLVDREYDHGKIVAQIEIPVAPYDTPETLENRVMAAEPGLFVKTLKRLAAGTLVVPAPRSTAGV